MAALAPVHAYAHAKVNLSLRVLAREISGYHQIETIFCALELADEIEISQTTEGVSLTLAPSDETGIVPDLGPVEENMAWRAATLFLGKAPLDHGVHLRLIKRIPAGAGLGGGSSDAAAVLRALNRMHSQPLPAEAVLEMGARLGSDVPFFLAGTPMALAWGRGERISPIPPLAPASILLAVPPERISTAHAYAALDAPHSPAPMLLRTPRSWADVAASAHNDFEQTVFASLPRLGALRDLLDDAGATIARLTGTGSVVFGVFADSPAAAAAARRIAGLYGDIETIITRTRTAG